MAMQHTPQIVRAHAPDFAMDGDLVRTYAALRMHASLLASWSLVVGLAACSDDTRPEISTQGLGQPCPDQGCITGQDCVTAAAPAGETRTCEIPCDADSNCPRQLLCNVPPIVPDSLANVCIRE